MVVCDKSQRCNPTAPIHEDVSSDRRLRSKSAFVTCQPSESPPSPSTRETKQDMPNSLCEFITVHFFARGSSGGHLEGCSNATTEANFNWLRSVKTERRSDYRGWKKNCKYVNVSVFVEVNGVPYTLLRMRRRAQPLTQKVYFDFSPAMCKSSHDIVYAGALKSNLYYKHELVYGSPLRSRP